MRTCNGRVVAAFAALMILAPAAVGAEDVPTFASATDAYRQGMADIKRRTHRDGASEPRLCGRAARSRRPAEARADLRGGRRRGQGRRQGLHLLPADRRPARRDQSAQPRRQIRRRSLRGARPILSQGGSRRSSLRPIPRGPPVFTGMRRAISATPTRNTRWPASTSPASGVDKNIGLAANWLAMAAKKQHAAAQAELGELLWHGDDDPRATGEGARPDHARPRECQGGAARSRIGSRSCISTRIASADAATRKEARRAGARIGRHVPPTAGAAAGRSGDRSTRSDTRPADAARRAVLHARGDHGHARRLRQWRRGAQALEHQSQRAQRLSSSQTGTWSDGFSQPRGAGSISHLTSRSAACGDSSRWSMRKPWFFCQAPA